MRLALLLLVLAMTRTPSGLRVPEHGIVQARGYRGAPVAAMMGAHRRVAHVGTTDDPTGPNDPGGLAVIYNDPMSDAGYLLSGGKGTVVSDASDDPISPPTALRGNYLPGDRDSVGDPTGDEAAGGVFATWNFSPVKTLYTRSQIKFNTDFELHPSTTKVSPWIYTVKNVTPGDPAENHPLFFGAQGTEVCGVQQWLHTYNWGQQGGGHGEVAGGPHTYPFGSYFDFETLMVGNDNGQANGVIKAWVNGTLVINGTNAEFDATVAALFARVLIDPFWGGGGSHSWVGSGFIEYGHMLIKGA